MYTAPIVGAIEAGAAALAGHVPGVALGLFSAAWSLALKGYVVENASGLKPAVNLITMVLNLWVMVVLGVRAVTFGVDTRYADSFPRDAEHPAGCTRIARTNPCRSKGIEPPIFKGKSVREVQDVARAWIEKLPRTSIKKDQPGYIHAQVLSLLMGFPDNLAVRIIDAGDGNTEVWLQGELRLGESDLGVNAQRVAALLEYLKKSA